MLSGTTDTSCKKNWATNLDDHFAGCHNTAEQFVTALVDQVEVEVLGEEDEDKGKTGVGRKPNFSAGPHWSSQLATHWFNNWVLIT